MSLAQLKLEAKNHTPKIKQYYIKSRLDLIKLLSLKEFPLEMVIAKKTIADLRKEAQERKLPNIWRLRRSELVELLYPSSKQDNENDNNGKEHNNPEKGERDEIRVHVLKNAE